MMMLTTFVVVAFKRIPCQLLGSFGSPFPLYRADRFWTCREFHVGFSQKSWIPC